MKFKFDFDWTPYPEESEGEVSREDIEFIFEPNLEQAKRTDIFQPSFYLNPISHPNFNNRVIFLMGWDQRGRFRLQQG